MTIHLRTSFSPDSAGSLATLVQPNLFNSITDTGAAMDIAFMASGGVLTGIVQDPCMRLLITGASPILTPVFVTKYFNYGGAYDDPQWPSQRPSHYRLRCNLSLNINKCFTVQERVELFRLFHNSGATGQSFAGVWWRKTATGWQYELEEYLWSGASCRPSWDYYGHTLATFTPYVTMAVDVVTTPGAAFIQVGQPYPAQRTITSGGGTTGIAGEGFAQLAIFGVTLPRIAGIEIGLITFQSVLSTCYTAGEARFDDIRFEDNFEYKYSPDQFKAVSGGSQNPAFEGATNDIDTGFVKMWISQGAFFGAPMNNLYTVGHNVGSNVLATKIPAVNIAVEPNSVYELSAVTDATVTTYGSTVVATRAYYRDTPDNDGPNIFDASLAANQKYRIRTGPTQNAIWVSCSQNQPFIYTLRKVQ